MSISNLHDPSSAQPQPAPSSSSSNSPAPTVQSEAIRLTDLKDSIQSRLDVYFEVLASNKVTMETPLIDPEGFPRADIDVAGIRTARSQIIRLRNDLKAVMNDMSSLLERGLPRETEKPKNEEEDQTGPQPMNVDENARVAFAKVDAVAPGGPSATAGLQRGDRIVTLGPVNASNHDSLKELAALVGKSEGVTLPLVILRGDGDSVLHLRLTPKGGWGGRGLLGCHVVPI
ncbi:hypothetical protein T439DRAFT_209680 [Meredithblackwellia eburnea MCA 4105]